MTNLRSSLFSRKLLLIVLLPLLFWSTLYAEVVIGTGHCYFSAAGGVFGHRFWGKSPALQGTIVHNYITEGWLNSGLLDLGASANKELVRYVRPDLFFDGTIRDIKPIHEGESPKRVVRKYRRQLKKYAEAVKKKYGYYPEVELQFYRLDPENRRITLVSEPYQVDLNDLGISESPLSKRVSLSQVIDFVNSTGPLRGMVFDERKNQFFLVCEARGGHRTTKVPGDDFVAAYRAVFASNYEGAMVTIDPDPEHLKSRGIVRFGGDVENTHLGYVLFECDRLLKSLSVGIDNISKKPITSRVGGYKNTLELAEFSGSSDREEQWTRFWFMPEEMSILVAGDGSALYFRNERIVVKTENMRWDGPKLVSDFTSAPGSYNARFASHFTGHYQEFAREFPAFDELTHVAKIVALFKWMKKYNIHVDIGDMLDHAIERVETPRTTPLVQNSYERSDTTVTYRKSVKKLAIATYSFSVIGGVDVQNFRFTVDQSGFLKSFKDVVLKAPESRPFRYGSKVYTKRFFATPSIPNLEIRKVLLGVCSELISDSGKAIKMGFDYRGNVVVYTDTENHTIYYEYDEHNRPVAIHTWDRPIRYQFERSGRKVSFDYEYAEGTNHYIKKVFYKGNTDVIKRVDIYHGNEKVHSFHIEIDGENVTINRRCRY